jgi:hypothetical protein
VLSQQPTATSNITIIIMIIVIQFFSIHVPSQQLQGELSTEHSVEIAKMIKSMCVD